ncbi:protein of unknown function [uncultured Sphingopyxis sp.]|uniref:HTH tetR-type domain-containing protein n=1 Tax=uncultured Sphingopyxis sp. TaxID=310581 RepID=A0A1Y5PP77_9SPHN|nr:helix-turn-helix domain-containing protein [uncultured Sphingopyxis sp.]SBV31818.1 protein of unknown function [uncultured Sphingopyxis sp.]
MIDALASLLAERRYEAIRIADIRERADIGKSTFYEHFWSKDELLLAAIEPCCSRWRPPPQAARRGLSRYATDGNGAQSEGPYSARPRHWRSAGSRR